MQNTEERRMMICPFNGTKCIEGRREDFPKSADGVTLSCRWWVHLYGKDPQSEKIIDQFDCSIAWLPVTTTETSQMVRQTAASVDKTANVLAEVGRGIAREAIDAAGRVVRLETSGGSFPTEAPQIPGPEAA